MNIYVGNLSYQATDSGLRELFSQFGEVKSVKIVKDHETGEPKGFAFVEMPDDESGKAAIEALNSKEFENRTLRINEARPKTNSGSRFNSFSSNYGYRDRFKTY